MSGNADWTRRRMQAIRDITFLIKTNYPNYQLFNTRNTVNDPMKTIYHQCNIQLDCCDKYGYLEIFGLSQEEFEDMWDDIYGMKELREEVIKNHKPIKELSKKFDKVSENLPPHISGVIKKMEEFQGTLAELKEQIRKMKEVLEIC